MGLDEFRAIKMIFSAFIPNIPLFVTLHYSMSDAKTKNYEKTF